MDRRTFSSIVIAAVLVGCSGATTPTTTPAAVATGTPTPATAAPSTEQAGPTSIESPIVGKWVGRHECQGIADALAAAGFDAAVILENIVGNGLVPGVEDPTQVADVAAACAAARPLEHSHEFTATGEFFSYDQDGEEVDNGTYRLVDADTLEIGAPDRATVAFDFAIEGDHLTLTPQGLAPGCLDFECQWAVMVAMPWIGMDRATG